MADEKTELVTPETEYETPLTETTEPEKKRDYKTLKRLCVVASRGMTIAGATCLTVLGGLYAWNHLPQDNDNVQIPRILILDSNGRDYQKGKPKIIVTDDSGLNVYRLSQDGVTYENAEDQIKNALSYSAELERNGFSTVNNWGRLKLNERKQNLSDIKDKVKKRRDHVLEERIFR